MTDTLDTIFDVEPQENLPVPLTKKPITSSNNIVYDDENALVEDLKNSRTDFDNIIELGQQALVEVLSIASQGQHPRFFEAAAMLIKSINEANRERMEVHLKLSEIRKNQMLVGGGAKSTTVNVDKAMFIGTTEELQKMMKKTSKIIEQHDINA